MSQINIGGIEADAIRIGNAEADAIYIGNELLYPSGENYNFRYKITLQDGTTYTAKDENYFAAQTDYTYVGLKPQLVSATSIVFGEKCIGNIHIPNEMNILESIVINSPQVTSFYVSVSPISSMTITNSSITTFQNDVLNDCTYLESFDIPSGVTSLGEDVLSYCSMLKHLTIPSTVLTIGYRAFNSSLTYFPGEATLTCYAVTPPTIGGYNFDNDMGEYCTLYVPSQSVAAYKAASEWRKFGDNIQPIPNS